MTIQASELQAPPGGAHSWLREWQRQGFGLRYAIAATVIGGMYLHLARLLLPPDQFLQHTATYGSLLTFPMAYAAIVSWIVWKQVVHPEDWHRILYGFLAVYFTISLPIHAHMLIMQSVEHVVAFPHWYSAAIELVQLGLLVFAWHLQFKDDEA
jgi:hypothetical protein